VEKAGWRVYSALSRGVCLKGKWALFKMNALDLRESG
jgi:hypothetical protein